MIDGKETKQRRQQHRSAWHWRQTDSCYFTEPGTKKRVPSFDEKGERIRGKENKEAARVAVAWIQVADELSTPALPAAAQSREEDRQTMLCDETEAITRRLMLIAPKNATSAPRSQCREARRFLEATLGNRTVLAGRCGTAFTMTRIGRASARVSPV